MQNSERRTGSLETHTSNVRSFPPAEGIPIYLGSLFLLFTRKTFTGFSKSLWLTQCKLGCSVCFTANRYANWKKKIFKLSSLFTCLDRGHKRGWRPGCVLEPGQVILARLREQLGAQGPIAPALHMAPWPPAAPALGSVGEGTR